MSRKRFSVGDLAYINRGKERGRLVEVIDLAPLNKLNDYTVEAVDGGLIESNWEVSHPGVEPARTRTKSIKDSALDPVPRKKWDDFMENLKTMESPIKSLNINPENALPNDTC